MDNKQFNWKVRVRCTTFNHAPYIVDALKGFTMQQTNFPFVCTIIDDASTDGEQEVIRAFLRQHFNPVDIDLKKDFDNDVFDFYYGQHKQNTHCFFAVYLLKYNHFGKKESKFQYFLPWRNKVKYIALCEGDDYWIQPQKLQKQVEYMEAHPDCSLCFHANRNLRSDGSYNDYHLYKKDKNECSMYDLIMGGGGVMATASMLYVRDATNDYPLWPSRCGVGDAPVMLVLAERGKVAYMNEVMCVYRVSTSGSWTQRVVNVRSAKKKHYKRIQKMWNDYDEWSNYKHHKYVVAKKIKNAIHYHIKMIKLYLRGK
jgi:glycosyltransferase involved in cell wall biosynthesis